MLSALESIDFDINSEPRNTKLTRCPKAFLNICRLQQSKQQGAC